MEGAALNQELVIAPFLPPEKGQVENLLFQFISVPSLAPGPVVPTFSIRAVSSVSEPYRAWSGSEQHPASLFSAAWANGGLLSSGEDDEAELPSSWVTAHAELDLELTATLDWAGLGTGLEWNPPPCPERSQFGVRSAHKDAPSCMRRLRSCEE